MEFNTTNGRYLRVDLRRHQVEGKGHTTKLFTSITNYYPWIDLLICYQIEYFLQEFLDHVGLA